MIKMKQKILTIIAVIACLVLLTACTQSISEIKTPEFEGKTVVVKGVVENPIKLGKLSGYTLKDNNGDTIPISTQNLPAEGSTKTVKGVLTKELLIGYYIKVD